MFEFEEYVNMINEGLLKAHDIDLTIDRLSLEFTSCNKFPFNIEKKNNNSFDLTINNFRYISNLEVEDILDWILDKIQNMYGWFPSKMKIIGDKNRTSSFDKWDILEKKNSIDELTITFESKFDIEVNIPSKLYHLSIQEYENDILSNGLITKQKSKQTIHSGRIYLCDDINNCRNLINNMGFFYENEKYDIMYRKNNPKRIYNKNTKWITYEIDTVGLTKLYKDPNYSGGFYILENISPNNISIIDKE